MRRDRTGTEIMPMPGRASAAAGFGLGPPAVQAFAGIPGFLTGNDTAERGESLWSVIDDRMRGRWRMAILIGLVLSAVLGILGYQSAAPLFQSQGMIRITQSVPHVIENGPDHELRNYDQFCATQIQYMKSPQVLQLALNDKELAALPWSHQPKAARALKAGLVIEQDPRSEFIYVAFEHEDPAVAQAAANAVIRAYFEKYGKHGGFDVNSTLVEAKSIEEQCNHMLGGLLQERRAIEQKYPIRDLHALQVNAMQELSRLDDQIKRGKRALARATGIAPGGASGAVAPSPKMLELRFPQLATLRLVRDQALLDFQMLKDHYLPGSAVYNSKKDKADRARAVYDEECAKAMRQWQFDGADMTMPDGTVEVLTAADLSDLESDAAKLRENQEKLNADVDALNKVAQQEDAVRLDLKKTTDRIRDLEIERNNLTSFISVGHEGEFPDQPNSDPRRKRTALGVAAGLMMSLGGFFLLGTIDRRAYHASQLQHLQGPNMPLCLGVLPDLGASLTDPESSDMASHCVHQIRNQIEAVREQVPGYVLAVTSPFQRDGKTSIVMALGWSYAAAGFNTLLVDCDFVGRSLTRQLGLIGREGLKDALVTRELNGSVMRMPVDNLSAVPAGVDARFGPENIRRTELEHLLQQVRQRFDVIIIDTGPMLGSLESTPVTAVADGVVLSVRRGRSRSRLEECVARLRIVGAQCIGMILNCAVRSDCNRYVSEASLEAPDEDRAARAANRNAPAATSSAGERNALVRAMQDARRHHKPAP